MYPEHNQTTEQKIKVTEIGQPCRHCGTPVEKREHLGKRKKRNKGGYYFLWWLGCPKCHAIYMVEAAKQYYDDKDALDLFSAAEFTKTNRTVPAPQDGWTAGTLRSALLCLPRDAPVRIFCPFDSEGPGTWEEPRIEIDNGVVKFSP